MSDPASDRGWGAPAAVTLEDVAREAGLSVTTASRVLNGSLRHVPEASRSRVEAAARRLGYAANRSAQAVARGASDSIALIVPDISDPYFSEIAAGAARAADEIGVLINIGVTGHEHERAREVVEALRGQRPRGIILASPAASGDRGDRDDGDVDGLDELRAVVAGRGRVVTIGGGAALDRGVIIDDRGGAHRLARELRLRGYDRAAVLSAGRATLAHRDRLDGFVAGFADGAGEVLDIQTGVSTRASGRQLMRRLLADRVSSGTVVFAASDVMAAGAFSAIRASGRRVGSDLALAGFGGTAIGRDLGPGLTTVRVPLAQAGHEALRAVVEDDWQCRSDPLELRLVVRGSTPRRRSVEKMIRMQ